MSKFMEEMRNELAGIKEKDIGAPSDKVEDGDKVVGVLESLEARRIHELKRRLGEAVEQKNQELEDPDLQSAARFDIESEDFDPKTSEICVLRRELRTLMVKLEALHYQFWACVHYELSEDDMVELDKPECGGLAIREGWQIVLYAREDITGDRVGQMLVGLFQGR